MDGRTSTKQLVLPRDRLEGFLDYPLELRQHAFRRGGSAGNRHRNDQQDCRILREAIHSPNQARDQDH